MGVRDNELGDLDKFYDQAAHILFSSPVSGTQEAIHGFLINSHGDSIWYQKGGLFEPWN